MFLRSGARPFLVMSAWSSIAGGARGPVDGGRRAWCRRLRFRALGVATQPSIITACDQLVADACAAQGSDRKAPSNAERGDWCPAMRELAVRVLQSAGEADLASAVEADEADTARGRCWHGPFRRTTVAPRLNRRRARGSAIRRTDSYATSRRRTAITPARARVVTRRFRPARRFSAAVRVSTRLECAPGRGLRNRAWLRAANAAAALLRDGAFAAATRECE